MSRRGFLLVVGLLGATEGGLALYAWKWKDRPIGLNPATFTPYKIIEKKQLSPTTLLFTVAPTGTFKKRARNEGVALESILVKHPLSQIGRYYTPLDAITPASPIRFVVKKYPEGELSNYLHEKPLGETIDIQGPFIDAQVNLDKKKQMFLGGTSISLAVQLLNKHPAAKVSVFYSIRNASEMLFPHMLHHCKVYTDTDRTLRASDIPSPSEDTATVVSGPDGYVEFVAGIKPVYGQGEIGGLLKEKGYKDVVKL